MELTTPDQGRVTAGLLVREMVSGMLQLGDTQMEPYAPAGVPVAGDPTNNPCPTYATLAKVASITPGTNTAPDRTGAPIDGALNTDGTVIPVTGDRGPNDVRLLRPRNEAQHRRAFLGLPDAAGAR